MSAHIFVKDLPSGLRAYRVHCEQHDYWSPWLTIYENALDLDRAHAVRAHGHKIKPTYNRDFTPSGERRDRSSVA